MRRRNCRVEIYFTKEELEALTKKYRKAGLSREGYCRRVLNDSVVKEAPPSDLHILIMEVRDFLIPTLVMVTMTGCILSLILYLLRVVVVEILIPYVTLTFRQPIWLIRWSR